MTTKYPHRMTCDLNTGQARFLSLITHRIFQRSGCSLPKVEVMRALLNALRRSGLDVSDVTTRRDLEERLLGRLRTR